MKRDVWKDNCVNLVIRGAFEEVHGYRYIGNAIAALDISLMMILKDGINGC